MVDCSNERETIDLNFIAVSTVSFLEKNKWHRLLNGKLLHETAFRPNKALNIRLVCLFKELANDIQTFMS